MIKRPSKVSNKVKFSASRGPAENHREDGLRKVLTNTCF